MKRRFAAFLAVLIISFSMFFLFFGALKRSEPQPVAALDSYIACGCGCCPDLEPNVLCIYQGNGDDLESIIAKDKLTSENPACSKVGCSIPIKYVYCD
ncbi:MAG: hypothetical protein V1909_05630 [Candidatus Micrarchaeota archaeon]